MDTGALVFAICLAAVGVPLFLRFMHRGRQPGESAEQRLQRETRRGFTWLLVCLMFPIVVGLIAALVVLIRALLSAVT